MSDIPIPQPPPATPPVNSVPQPNSVSAPDRPRTRISAPLTAILVCIVIAAGSGGIYYAYHQTREPKGCTMEAKLCPDGTSVGRSGPNCEFAPCPSPVASSPADTKTYTNSAYGYTVTYPSSYIAGFIDTIGGSFSENNPTASEISVLPSLGEEFDNFLEIQAASNSAFNTTFAALVQDNYTKNKTHYKTTRISGLQTSSFLGIPAYEYTYTGEAMTTLSWSGMVTEGEYKIVIFPKDHYIYSIYLKNTDTFNTILSSVTFTDAQRH